MMIFPPNASKEEASRTWFFDNSIGTSFKSITLAISTDWSMFSLVQCMYSTCIEVLFLLQVAPTTTCENELSYNKGNTSVAERSHEFLNVGEAVVSIRR